MSEYRHIDTKRADGCYVEFARKLTPDFEFEARDREEQEAINCGDLVVYGVQAEACIIIVRNGVGTFHVMSSAGCWGVVVKDDADAYLDDVFAEEREALRCDLTALGMWTETKGRAIA